MAIISKTNSFIIGGLEDIFTRWGKFVSIHPYPVILVSILVTVISSIGFLHFRMEHQANLLWIPVESDYNIRQDWIDKNFKSQVRYENILYKSENVLSPESLREMYQIYKRVSSIEVNGKQFENLCARVPIADIFQTKRRRRRRQVRADTNFQVTGSESTERSSDLSQPINETKIDDYGYYDDGFWDDEYALYSDEGEEEEEQLAERINFRKYGSKQAAKSNNDDVIDTLPDSIYCDLVTTLNEKCQQTSLLEIWRYDEQLISTTTQAEILDAVNILNKSPWFGYGTNYSATLGGISYNSSGHIVGALTTQIVWVLEVPDEAEVVDNQGSGLELELADQTSLEWEEEFIQIGLNSSSARATVLPNAAKSFGEVSTQAIFFDAFFMAGGYLIMFIYTILMLGKLNTLELRMFLTISGLVSIGMGMAISVGLSSLMGFPYTPMHAVLPFICLGIGIDDMFVIVQCWNNLDKDPENSLLSTPERMSLTMRHAGVAVTVTSLTDVFAFGIGAVTKMPGLESFCICTAIALGSIYLLQVSWFVAWMALDEKRIQSGRDGLLPCRVHTEFIASACSQKDRSAEFMKYYIPLLSSRIYQFSVIGITLILLVFGIFGSVLIRQTFKPWLLLPTESYMRRWLDIHDENYPNNGFGAHIYTGTIDHTNLASIENLSNSLDAMEAENTYIHGINDWWKSLKNYAFENKNYTSWEEFSDNTKFPELFSDFLFSDTGTIFKSNFKFDGKLICNQPAPPILASKLWFTYLHFDGPEQHIPAKRKVEQVIFEAGLPAPAFSFSKIYAAWETDEIIGFELWRNIGLAMVCVFIITLILLANLRICLMVLTSVILTVADIVGFLHFWDITIDVISCVNIVLAIGLCVDYSVHIGHAYIVATGTKKEKAQEAISNIGPAVFNGGFTTFLALVLLGASSSHVFQSFFKVFVLTVLFGLFHGLVLFPVLLAMLGPDAVSKTEEQPINIPVQSAISMVGAAATQQNQHSQVQPRVTNRGLDNPTFVADEVQKIGVLEQPWHNRISPKSGRED